MPNDYGEYLAIQDASNDYCHLRKLIACRDKFSPPPAIVPINIGPHYLVRPKYDLAATALPDPSYLSDDEIGRLATYFKNVRTSSKRSVPEMAKYLADLSDDLPFGWGHKFGQNDVYQLERDPEKLSDAKLRQLKMLRNVIRLQK